MVSLLSVRNAMLGVSLTVGMMACSSDNSIGWNDLIEPGVIKLSSNETAILKMHFPSVDYDSTSSYSWRSYIFLDSSLDNLEELMGNKVLSTEIAENLQTDSVTINQLLQNLIQINLTKIDWTKFQFDLDNDYYFIPTKYVERDWGSESEMKSAMGKLYPHHGVKLSRIAFNEDSTLALMCIYPYPFLRYDRLQDVELYGYVKSEFGWYTEVRIPALRPMKNDIDN